MSADLTQALNELEAKRLAAIAEERIARDSAFLHRPDHPLLENIAGFPALPLNLFHCNLLRMMGSPFMTPFATPTPEQLAAFLWVVNPEFTNQPSPAKRRLLKACRVFLKPPLPFWKNRLTMRCWETLDMEAFIRFGRVVQAARAYMAEALNDRPPPVQAAGMEQPEYYSDFCSLAATLMRQYHGLSYDRIQTLPMKVIYQFLKEAQEHAALKRGEPPLLWNGSDDFTDQQLALLNQRN